MRKIISIILSLFILTVAASIPASAATVAAGVNHSVIVADNGTVWAWGRNTHGQLGDGTRFTRNAAVRVDISDVVAVAAGNGHTVALREDGTVWSCEWLTWLVLLW